MDIEFVETGVATETNGCVGSEQKVLRTWHVDDNKNFRELLATFLSQEPGFKCERSLPSAESALDALANEKPPDIILLDIRMDGMSGLDAIAPIKRLAPQTAVLMLSTLYGPDDRRRAIESGASDMLSKSLRVEEIVERARWAHEGLIQARTNERPQANESVPLKPATKRTDIAALRALHECLNCRPAKQPTDSTPLRRFANVIRQVRMAWAARLRRRQASVSVSS